MEEDADTILMSMGYSHANIENKDELILHHVATLIIELTFDLYLSQLYCRKVKLLVQTILDNGFDEKVVLRVLEHFDKQEFNYSEVLSYCRLLEKSPSIPSVKSDFSNREHYDVPQNRYATSTDLHTFHGDSSSYYPTSGSNKQNTFSSLANEPVPDCELYDASDSINKPADIPNHQSMEHRYYQSPNDYDNVSPDVVLPPNYERLSSEFRRQCIVSQRPFHDHGAIALNNISRNKQPFQNEPPMEMNRVPNIYKQK